MRFIATVWKYSQITRLKSDRNWTYAKSNHQDQSPIITKSLNRHGSCLPSLLSVFPILQNMLFKINIFRNEILVRHATVLYNLLNNI